jgi:exosortase C (VPDSG-CTERM-specific)
LKARSEPVVKPAEYASRLRALAIVSGSLVLCFAVPLYRLARFAMKDDFFSFIPLIPLVSGYLVWNSTAQPPVRSKPAPVLALLFAGAGLLLLGFLVRFPPGEMEDYLAYTMAAFLLFFYAATSGLAGGELMRTHAFPLAMLVFIVPWPTSMLVGVETALQHASAATAEAFFTMAGTPVDRDGLTIQLPGLGFPLFVAPECSGIHSSLVLLITSLLAGHLFLHTGWKRWLLALAVVPLGIARNGFRIATIGELCVRVSPTMIHSWVHKRGGPLFFVLSLVPLFFLLVALQRSDRRVDTHPGKVADK